MRGNKRDLSAEALARLVKRYPDIIPSCRGFSRVIASRLDEGDEMPLRPDAYLLRPGQIRVFEIDVSHRTPFHKYEMYDAIADTLWPDYDLSLTRVDEFGDESSICLDFVAIAGAYNEDDDQALFCLLDHSRLCVTP